MTLEDREGPVRGWGQCFRHTMNRHFFGSVTSDPLGPSTYEAATLGRFLDDFCCPEPQPHLMLLTVDAIEVIRVAGEPVTPLTGQQILTGSALPAGALRIQNRSQLKVRVSINRGTMQHRFLMDMNQQIEFHAVSVGIDIVGASNLVEVNMDRSSLGPSVPAAPLRAGLVIDELVGQTVARIEAPTGLRDVIFTENVFVAANTREVLEVPPYATDLTVYQSSIGAAETVWEMHYGDPTVGSVEAGTIPWIVGARKSEPLIEFPNVTHLRTGIDVDNGRFFTLRWTIRP